MISKEDFENLLKIETKARDFYDELLKDIRNETVRRNIESIRDDEIRHMKLAQRLIDIISK